MFSKGSINNMTHLLRSMHKQLEDHYNRVATGLKLQHRMDRKQAHR